MNKLSNLIKIRVYPDSSKEQIVVNKDSYSVFLREPAKAGLANKRLLQILASFLKPKPRRIRIVSGALSPSKIIAVEY